MNWCNIGRYVGFHWSNYEDNTELKSPVGGLSFWRVVGQKTVLQRLFSSSEVSSVILCVASQSSPSNPKCSSSRHKSSEHQQIYRQERQWINQREHSGTQRENTIGSATIHRSQVSKVYCLCDSMNSYIFSLMFPIMEGPQQSSTSRFTIHLLNCYSFGTNTAVTN